MLHNRTHLSRVPAIPRSRPVSVAIGRSARALVRPQPTRLDGLAMVLGGLWLAIMGRTWPRVERETAQILLFGVFGFGTGIALFVLTLMGRV